MMASKWGKIAAPEFSHPTGRRRSRSICSSVVDFVDSAAVHNSSLVCSHSQESQIWLEYVAERSSELKKAGRLDIEPYLSSPRSSLIEFGDYFLDKNTQELTSFCSASSKIIGENKFLFPMGNAVRASPFL